jgi:cyclopropane fatty-acyl-phospholipid synthase-like methyltransferase
MQQFLDLLPPEPQVLDAACGTGKYWRLLLDHGVNIHGIDHSSKMLEVAQAKFPRVRISKMRLQDIDYVDKFDGIICMDAMEYVFPEHWPIVVKKFARALKAGGVTYLTVEIPDERTLRESYHKNLNANLPIRLGEDFEDGGYHYYPSRDLVRGWLSEYFDIKHAERGDYYHHYILRKKT